MRHRVGAEGVQHVPDEDEGPGRTPQITSIPVLVADGETMVRAVALDECLQHTQQATLSTTATSNSPITTARQEITITTAKHAALITTETHATLTVTQATLSTATVPKTTVKTEQAIFDNSNN